MLHGLIQDLMEVRASLFLLSRLMSQAPLVAITLIVFSLSSGVWGYEIATLDGGSGLVSEFSIICLIIWETVWGKLKVAYFESVISEISTI